MPHTPAATEHVLRSLFIACSIALLVTACGEDEPVLFQCGDDTVEACSACKSAPILCRDTDACVADCAASCPGSVDCGASRCVFTEDDPNHCGGCNQACARNQECFEASCVCEYGYADCSVDRQGCETHLLTDDDHCGGCGFDCGPDYQCCEGRCRFIAADPNNCGSCDSTCNSNELCLSGQCLRL